MMMGRWYYFCPAQKQPDSYDYGLFAADFAVQFLDGTSLIHAVFGRLLVESSLMVTF